MTAKRPWTAYLRAAVAGATALGDMTGSHARLYHLLGLGEGADLASDWDRVGEDWQAALGDWQQRHPHAVRRARVDPAVGATVERLLRHAEQSSGCRWHAESVVWFQADDGYRFWPASGEESHTAADLPATWDVTTASE